jgi:hypothetical protein
MSVEHPRAMRDGSQQGSEFVASQTAIAKDLAQQTRSDRLTRMDGNHGRPPVRVLQVMVTCAGPNHREVGPLQGGDDSLAGQSRQLLMMRP